MMHNEPMHNDAMHHAEMDGAIRICLECHSTCEHTIQHCLEKGAMHAAAAHIAVMRDCVQLCITCADFMAQARVCTLRFVKFAPMPVRRAWKVVKP